MRHLSFVLLIFLFVDGSYLAAQPSAREQYDNAVAAFQRGDASVALRILEPAVRSNELKNAELGRAWGLLGASYKAEAQYGLAQRAYENAIPLLKDDPLSTRDYEIVLRSSGATYREMGQLRPAEKLQLQSLRLSEKNHDHAEIARDCAGLAEISLDRKHLEEGKRYIARSEEESRLTEEFDDDDRAYLAQVQGLIALEDGDMREAIHHYQHSVDLFSNRYGENFALTGWGHILLGNAYSRDGAQDMALEETQRGVTILKRTVGINDPRYAVAEVLYAGVLNTSGQHAAADQFKAEGEATLQKIRQRQCSGCVIGDKQ
jgi:tetratricopeptide (TPR) repeat protein